MRSIGVGVRFLDLSDEARDLIENVLYDRPMRPQVVAARPAELRANEEAAPPAPKPAVAAQSDVITPLAKGSPGGRIRSPEIVTSADPFRAFDREVISVCILALP